MNGPQGDAAAEWAAEVAQLQGVLLAGQRLTRPQLVYLSRGLEHAPAWVVEQMFALQGRDDESLKVLCGLRPELMCAVVARLISPPSELVAGCAPQLVAHLAQRPSDPGSPTAGWHQQLRQAWEARHPAQAHALITQTFEGRQPDAAAAALALWCAGWTGSGAHVGASDAAAPSPAAPSPAAPSPAAPSPAEPRSFTLQGCWEAAVWRHEAAELNHLHDLITGAARKLALQPYPPPSAPGLR